MSYDLYFRGREISAAEFSDYFSTHQHYQVKASQAIYQNKDTGVYFIFDHTAAKDPETPPSSVSFNLNFIRPHIFALEADPEIRSLVETFSFTVFDPQNSGMGTGAYSSEGFIRGWNAGNEFGLRSIAQKPEAAGSFLVYPSDKMEQYWIWNLDREATQARLSDQIFVPKISFLKKEGQAVSFVVWGDAIPALLPKVDYVLIPRKDLAPRSFFRAKEDVCLISFQEIADVLGRYATTGFGLPALHLPFPISPADVVDFVRKLEPFAGELEAVPMDKVLDQESVDRSKPKP